MKLKSLTAAEVIIINDDDDNNNNNDIAWLTSFDNTVSLASSDYAVPFASFDKYNLFFILNFKTYIIDYYIIFFL